MKLPLRSKVRDLLKPQPLRAVVSLPEAFHRFTEESLWALDMALLTGRPLLIRGEPGIGKSQIARAAAEVLGVPFLFHVVDERTERDDLLYHYDAVSRLARAQIGRGQGEELSEWNAALAEVNFFRPGILWWAMNWESADDQRELFSKYCRPSERLISVEQRDAIPADAPCSAVVLIDEIDKADPSVPNGLLESLGSDGFRTGQLERWVSLSAGSRRPLIVLTTNEERELPAAFLRRCLVMTVAFPDGAQAEEFLIKERARTRFSEEEIEDSVCREAVRLLMREREGFVRQSAAAAKPGAAEFLDLVTALVEMGRPYSGQERSDIQLAALRQISGFALVKSLKE